MSAEASIRDVYSADSARVGEGVGNWNQFEPSNLPWAPLPRFRPVASWRMVAAAWAWGSGPGGWRPALRLRTLQESAGDA